MFGISIGAFYVLKMPLQSLKILRNRLDFWLRSRIRFSKKLPPDFAPTPLDLELQKELVEFLTGFPLADRCHEVNHFDFHINVADVGARNFNYASVYDGIFRKAGFKPAVYGIEVDAYRRTTDFLTRKAVGDFFASKIPEGHFVAGDFLEFKKPLHVIFLLSPFVGLEPLLKWGLPPKLFEPDKLFEHCYKLLKPQSGLMLLSTPSFEEFETAVDLARKVGFKVGHFHKWDPTDDSPQIHSRYGIVLTTV